MVKIYEKSLPLAARIKTRLADKAFGAFGKDSPVNAAAQAADDAAGPFLTQEGAVLRAQALGAGLILNAV